MPNHTYTVALFFTRFKLAGRGGRSRLWCCILEKCFARLLFKFSSSAQPFVPRACIEGTLFTLLLSARLAVFHLVALVSVIFARQLMDSHGMDVPRVFELCAGPTSAAGAVQQCAAEAAQAFPVFHPFWEVPRAPAALAYWASLFLPVACRSARPLLDLLRSKSSEISLQPAAAPGSLKFTEWF